VIGDVELKWNSKNIDWVNSANAMNEVGCIHTTQGYDLNYVGVIIGPELDYDPVLKTLIVYPERYKDKAGKNTIKDVQILKDYILNIYKTIILRGIRGSYIYACNPHLREYLSQFMDKNVQKKDEVFEIKFLDSPNERTVPFYNLSAAAGSFSDVQLVDDAKFIELENSPIGKDSYFACRVVGESMNKVIPSGSICLFERYTAGSRNGKIVLVELTDFRDEESGSCYTVKEYSSKKTVSDEGWEHTEIRLLPLSTEPFSPIVLRDEESQRLKVIGVFVRVVGKW
jgi:SOS-response transcriptional repressor LexA